MNILAFKLDGDAIEGLIILIILAGSALSGLGKWIITKINEKKEAERMAREGTDLSAPSTRDDEREIAIPPRDVLRTPPPPARPMPPRPPTLRPVTRSIPPAPRPVVRDEPRPSTRQTVSRQIELEVPESVRPLVEMFLGRSEQDEGDEDETPQVRPTPPPPRPAAPRPKRQTPAPQAEATRIKVVTPAKLERIERREAREAKLAEQRIGHVETHVASAITDDATRPRKSPWLDPTDRPSLRRAIILNELLGPPVSLRTPDSF